MRILVTRPQPQSETFAERLKQQGHDPVAVPLSEIIPFTSVFDTGFETNSDTRPEFETACRIVMELDNYQKVIAVSVNAARYGAEVIDRYWPQWPAGIQWFAVGSKTAAELESWGQPVKAPNDMSSEGLLVMEELQQLDYEKVLLLCGEGGRELLQRDLEQRGAQVQRCELYRRQEPISAEGDLTLALQSHASQPFDAITVTSGEILHTLYQLLNKLPQPGGGGTPLFATALIVPSERIAQQANTMGWQKVILARNATDEAMLVALQEI
ncbi:MAG: uroporphyrinogen-III synthase [Cellvibrionaceae bacterium]